MDDEKLCNEVRDVLSRLDQYGGWENAPIKTYWEEQRQKADEWRRKRGRG